MRNERYADEIEADWLENDRGVGIECVDACDLKRERARAHNLI